MTSTPGQESVNTLTGDRETPFEHLAIRDVDHVQEYVDTRLSLGSRPAADELDESFPQALVRALSRDGHNHQHTDPQTRTVSVNSCDLEKEKGLKSDTYEEILYVCGLIYIFFKVPNRYCVCIRSIGRKAIPGIPLTIHEQGSGLLPV